MRRRLDIAMSLIGNPAIIFLDEPTTGLDPQGRLEVWDVVKELAALGTTVVLTTQYLDEAEQLADRVAILHEGRIIVNGTMAELTRLLPPAQVEYVEKRPTLEDVFFRPRRVPRRRRGNFGEELRNLRWATTSSAIPPSCWDGRLSTSPAASTRSPRPRSCR
jgi:ABC-type multidrug transport system ATPase subunit